MKKLNQSLFAFVAMLVFASVAMAQNLPTYTADQARKILSVPERFVQIYKQEQVQKDNTVCFPGQIVIQLLDAVGGQEFLRKIYSIYVSYNPTNESAREIVLSAHIPTNALLHMRMSRSNDAYFKRVFEKVTDSRRDVIIRAAALLKIKDLKYIEKVITEEAKVDEGAPNPGAIFLQMRGGWLYKADQLFVDTLAIFAVDSYVRAEAIALQNFAQLDKK